MSLPVKHRYFFRKKYLASDSTERQEAVETAIARHFLKRSTCGLMSTPTVSADPTPNAFLYSIESNDGSNPIQGHDLNGLYVEADANPYVTDDLTNLARQGGGFTPPTATNEKYVTLVLRFFEVQAQPEIEKLSFTTVNFRREASFEIGVIEGVEAPLGTAVVPSLAGESGLYLADILIIDTDTDATTTVITTDVATPRLKLDPIREAADRGMDGILRQLAFLTDIPPAVNPRPGTPPTTVGGTTGGSGTIITIPAGTRFVGLAVEAHVFDLFSGGGNKSSLLSTGKYVIDVATDTLTGGLIFFDDVGGTGNYKQASVGIVDPNVAGTNLALIDLVTAGALVTVETVSYSATVVAGGTLTLESFNVPATGAVMIAADFFG
jgi:hypothetical protein